MRICVTVQKLQILKCSGVTGVINSLLLTVYVTNISVPGTRVKLHTMLSTVSSVCLLIWWFLFRYTGIDDTQTANTDKRSQAKRILQQLHEQAALRQQEREATDRCKQSSSDTDGKEPLINE